jgi:hypothetical protein
VKAVLAGLITPAAWRFVNRWNELGSGAPAAGITIRRRRL